MVKNEIIIFALVVIMASLLSTLIYSNTTLVTTTLTVSHGTCGFSISSGSINFGLLYIGGHTSGTVNTIAITDTGIYSSNIYVSGSNWNWGANSFGVSNTIYNSIIQPYFVQPSLSFAQTDTLINVNALATNDLSWGVAFPASAPAGSYSQTINIISSC